MLVALLLASLLDASPEAGPPRAAMAVKGAKAAPALAPAQASDVLSAVAAARGKVVLLNFWATWCLPCREEMPHLLALRRELGARGFDVVLVSADFEEDAGLAREFLGSLGVDFTTWRKSQRDEEFIEGISPTWSGVLPFTVLYDRDGRPATSWVGGASLETLRSKILPLMSTKGTVP